MTILYDFRSGRQHGEVVIATSRFPHIFYRVLHILSSALMVAGLAGLVFTAGPLVLAELSYRLDSVLGSNHETIPAGSGFGILARQRTDYEKMQQQAREWGITDTNFALYIPKINARANIIDNVDPDNYKVYMAALKQGVAHAQGSSFPGRPGATYLFAHSTDAPWHIVEYNAVFYLLRELDDNDEIYVFFLDKIHKYRLTQKIVTGADDRSWLAKANEGQERLILQTCWPPGTTWKRLIVVADPVK